MTLGLAVLARPVGLMARKWFYGCPILNIFIRSEDIRRWNPKSSEIAPNFACFWPQSQAER